MANQNVLPDDACSHWRELEFMAADREFDGGEFSGPAQVKRGMKHDPCGKCSACTEGDEPEAVDIDVGERELEEALRCLLEDHADDFADTLAGACDAEFNHPEEESVVRLGSVRTFADRGLLTQNAGLVLRIGDAEFQLTIVRSR
jgi:hypothetical protein